MNKYNPPLSERTEENLNRSLCMLRNMIVGGSMYSEEAKRMERDMVAELRCRRMVAAKESTR